MSFESRIRKIVDDHEHGSSYLVEQICSVLQSLESLPEGHTKLPWAFEQLQHIDPSMAVVRHLLNHLDPSLGRAFFAELRRYQSRWHNVHQRVAQQLESTVKVGGKQILVHSHSWMVVQVLSVVSKQSSGLRVVQTRSLPGGEGVTQCRDLEAAGLQVTLIEDADVVRAADSCDFACLGADQFTADAFVNKVGSLGITQTMAAQGKSTFVLADARKRVKTLHYSTTLFEPVPFGERTLLMAGEK